MKNASHILTSLRQKPSFSKLARWECIRRIRELFPPRLQQMIRYGYYNGDTLYFVLDHPGAKQEFDNIIATIKEPLRLYTPKACTANAPKEIRAFVKHTPAVQTSEAFRRRTDVHYAERAEGHFTPRNSDSNLFDVFERIRSHIYARTDS